VRVGRVWVPHPVVFHTLHLLGGTLRDVGACSLTLLSVAWACVGSYALSWRSLRN